MLPSIMLVAIQHGLQMNERSTHSIKDVRFKCPFCQALDGPKNKDKYYLSLNTRDNVYKCWSCGESGGVLKLIALLENTSIEEVKRKLWGSKKGSRRKLHPAEKLTPSQLKAAGFVQNSWGKLRQKESQEYYKNTLDWVWSEWLDYVVSEKRRAYMHFYEASTSEKITSIIHDCAAKISVKPEDLLLEFTKAKFSKKKPQWAESAEEWLALAKG